MMLIDETFWLNHLKGLEEIRQKDGCDQQEFYAEHFLLIAGFSMKAIGKEMFIDLIEHIKILVPEVIEKANDSSSKP